MPSRISNALNQPFTVELTPADIAATPDSFAAIQLNTQSEQVVYVDGIDASLFFFAPADQPKLQTFVVNLQRNLVPNTSFGLTAQETLNESQYLKLYTGVLQASEHFTSPIILQAGYPYALGLRATYTAALVNNVIYVVNLRGRTTGTGREPFPLVYR